MARMIMRISLLLPVVCIAACDGNGGDSGPAPIDCALFPEPLTSEYILPWQVGDSYQAFPHIFKISSVQKYAIDAPMPIGTPIVAMRSGRVVRVVESFVDFDNAAGHENSAYVEHDDGTVARYIHLTNDGALVNVGDFVNQGEAIALSGHTGNSSAPHLHFDVTHSCCAVAPNYNEEPFGVTQPLTFRNTAPETCGLRNGIFYEALSY
jgi:murein DD-endopeptidase MepM/ murein hydrolase activator NlpD